MQALPVAPATDRAMIRSLLDDLTHALHCYSVDRWYEKVVIVCSAFVDMIPLSFILGFYVSFTAARWWNQYEAIPWPDK